MPWKECGYSIGVIVLVAALYIGAYYALLDEGFVVQFEVDHVEGHVIALKSVPTFKVLGCNAGMVQLFGAAHAIDVRIRPNRWSLQP